jgi:hypothetical protein
MEEREWFPDLRAEVDKAADRFQAVWADLARERFAREVIDRALHRTIDERDRLEMALEEEQELHSEAKAERDRLRAVVGACPYCSAVADTLDVSPTTDPD